MSSGKLIFRDIRSWIVIVFLFQLIFITRPPLEPAHSWRQSLTNMMARNFIQENASFILPEIDIAGEHEGVIASELPVLQYLMSWLYRWFGFAHWYGRFLNLLVSMAGIYCFTRSIAVSTKNEPLAFFSGLFLLFSNWFSFSVKSMPDTFSVSLAMMALFGLTQFVFQHRNWGLIVFVFLGSLSMLSKIPAALMLAPAVLYLFNHHLNKKQKWVLALSGGIALLPVLYWYGIWVPEMVNKYKFELFFPRSIKDGAQEIWKFKNAAADKLFNKGFSSYILSLLGFLGIFMAIKNRSKVAIGLMFVILPVFAFYAVKTGLVWATHSYYMVPLVPFMSLSAAYMFTRLKTPVWILIIGILGIAESVGTQWNDYFIRDNKRYLLQLESECNQFSDRTQKIVCNGTPNPQLMYFFNRRGWSLGENELTDDSQIAQILKFKPGWLILDRHREDAEIILEKWRNIGTVAYTSEHLYAIKLTQKDQ